MNVTSKITHQLLDYVSVYSAVLRGEDPSATAPIEELKRIISKK